MKVSTYDRQVTYFVLVKQKSFMGSVLQDMAMGERFKTLSEAKKYAKKQLKKEGTLNVKVTMEVQLPLHELLEVS